MNKITIELCAEDRARLDRLAEALERRTCDSCVRSALELAGAVPPAPIAAAETVAEQPAPAPVPDPVKEPTPPPVREISLEEFQKTLTLRCAESEAMKANVRELLHEYAPAASKVPPEKRAEVLERLSKL